MPPITIIFRLFVFFFIIITLFYFVWVGISFLISGRLKRVEGKAEAYHIKEEGIGEVRSKKYVRDALREVEKEKRK